MAVGAAAAEEEEEEEEDLNKAHHYLYKRCGGMAGASFPLIVRWVGTASSPLTLLDMRQFHRVWTVAAKRECQK